MYIKNSHIYIYDVSEVGFVCAFKRKEGVGAVKPDKVSSHAHKNPLLVCFSEYL